MVRGTGVRRNRCRIANSGNVFGGPSNSTATLKERTSMRNTKFLLVLAVTAFLSTLATAQMAAPPPAKTPGDAINAVLGIGEGEFVGAADAMPEDKYSF